MTNYILNTIGNTTTYSQRQLASQIRSRVKWHRHVNRILFNQLFIGRIVSRQEHSAGLQQVNFNPYGIHFRLNFI